jgi:hypothetical protein
MKNCITLMKSPKVVSTSGSPLRKNKRSVFLPVADKRRCPLCDRVFELPDSSTTDEHESLHCPTPHCRGTSDMWVHPGDPLTSDEAFEDWERVSSLWEKRFEADDEMAA